MRGYPGTRRTAGTTVCVVIPCHRWPLLPYERVALDRCMTVLGGYATALVAPRTMNAAGLKRQYPMLRIEPFPDAYFAGVAGYNRMLLADEFYARFAMYEYILIHQLDAFVFQDQLGAWCARDFDYIGAPWLPRVQAPSAVRLIRAALRRRWYRLVDRHDPHHGGTHHAQYDYAVGNGGFSLRRVEGLRKVLRDHRRRLARYIDYGHFTEGEDLFFCVEANRYRRRVRTPGLREAAAFAWESHPAAAAAITGGRLPFGCHGWNRLHRDDWRPIFARFGIALDELLQETA